MVSLELTLPLTVLAFSIIYIGLGVREQNRLKASQLRLEQIQFINDPDIDRAITEILWVWKWESFDEYWEKYSPNANPEANVTRRLARNYYVALASMMRKGDLEIGLLNKLNPSGVTRYWEKIGPIATEFRKRNNYQNYLEPVEYLAEKIAEHRSSKGISSPGKVS